MFFYSVRVDDIKLLVDTDYVNIVKEFVRYILIGVMVLSRKDRGRLRLYRDSDVLSRKISLDALNRDEFLASYVLNMRGSGDDRFSEELSKEVSLGESEYSRRFLTLEDGVFARVGRLVGMFDEIGKINKVFDEIDRVGTLYEDYFVDRSDCVGYVNRLITLDRSLLKLVVDRYIGNYLVVGDVNDYTQLLPRLDVSFNLDELTGEYRLGKLFGDSLSILRSDKLQMGDRIDDIFEEDFVIEFYSQVADQVDVGVWEFTLSHGDRSFRSILKGTSNRMLDGNSMRYDMTIMDVTELEHSVSKVLKRAYHDELTGLPTRELFNKRLRESLHECEGGFFIGVMFVDVDDFKIINDTYGHDVGDAVLIEIANRLKGSLRVGDVVARNGGDEFTLFCKYVKSSEDLSVVVNRIMETITEHPVLTNGLSIDVSLSIGISRSSEGDYDDERLIKHADIAMYKAKNSGKNKYRFFDLRMMDDELARLELLNDLRNALNRGEFSLKYQVQYDAVDSRYVGLEALIRWERGDHGYVSPAEFLEVAEESNLIVDIGYWVIEESCNKLVELHRSGYDYLKMYVNLSLKQFKSVDLVERVRDVLASSGLPFESLVLEITEKTAMDDVERTKMVLRELRDIGVFVSIDDFGTGFSSLSYLNVFPLTNLKIDTSFISDVAEKDGSVPIVSAFINLARDLNLDVVAEGVETEMQYNVLRSLGCTKFQGYFFAKPEDFDVVKELISGSVKR